MYTYYNPNPNGIRVDDCVIRGITKITGMDWNTAFLDLCLYAYEVKNMPSVNSVWGGYLKRHGFRFHGLSDTCPDCYTVKDFCADHPTGVFLLATGTHVIAVVDGDYYDSSDTGEEIPVYYFER